MKKIIILFYFFRVCLSSQPVTDLKEDVSYLSEIKDDEVDFIGGGEILSGSLFKTVQKYYCRAEIEGESDFLLFGTRAWTFPAQDVTLSLSYPSENHRYDETEDFGYILTKLKVIVRHDGVSSKGYITDGGMLQSHISMKFVFSNITSVTYQFSLHGMRKNLANYTDNFTSLFNLC
ncbi:uncharacterized protein LOC125072655 [Vanessa atalanta]|uniref:uncharacterized protein LOC125072655 n=1 Tax=Vanessa atalanta TaxID=42275 RepID=UPI001FCCCD4F|nr:uncharacterized protein LOC125072655 [Vanessa atalanta]